MESRIPLPTDNIYKFYALFGLLAFMFSIGGIIAVQRSTNDFMYKSLIDLEAVKSVEKPTAADTIKRQLLERLIDVAKSDKDYFNNSLSGLATVGFLLMGFGFFKWHREIQPLQDEMLSLQVAKLRREVQATSPSPPPAPLPSNPP
ncbi:hypothetical protein ASC78_08420 [Variovorax sp. Root318D1]|uniref:hypothetical protein n=1 Tax=Variovorax sp. Root318D1 TaxID=1736513 RepID=UPI0006F98CFF|nr:hypothetical protein [Variovorax sp. Root318D1]KQU85365.1 hypothetical protein ASC78_08420 [Variovorax sp. Root318D1]